MVERKKAELESTLEIGDVFEIDVCDPKSGVEVMLKIMVLGFFIEMQSGQRIHMARCRFVFVSVSTTGLEFSMPVTNLYRFRKVRSDQYILEQIRARIGNVDRQIAKLIARRLELAEAAGRIKRDLGIAIEDREQEARVRENIRRLAVDFSLDPEKLWVIFREIIEWSKEVQEELQ